MRKTYNVSICNIFAIDSKDMEFIFKLCPDYCGQTGNGSIFYILGFKTLREAKLFISSANFFCHIIRNYHNVTIKEVKL